MAFWRGNRDARSLQGRAGAPLDAAAQATEEDDKLDADWVVLSACNTAAGGSDKPGAEALSGLARAFFYAGARALLVSHWAVNSDAPPSNNHESLRRAQS
jgi:CHAT domain-containing protein